ncbi:hypothetical protein GmHk_15G044134 [Glycine max]|nr:hypothetical protein GmHk_15G044134 [Glycine max]
MNESRMSPEYEDGVEQFLQFASERGRPNEEGKYYCPCINCLNGRRQLLDDIRDHLLCDGIKKNYTTWIWHGEVTDMQSGSQSEPFDVEIGDRFHCSGHWQMVVILPKEQLVVWFCSLHNRPDNYLKGIINSAIKGLDDAPQPKSKAPARWIVVKCNRQKGTTECGYYVMHWMSTIILGTFRNNCEAYFNDPRPLEPERLKALWIQWAQFYLRVRDQA